MTHDIHVIGGGPPGSEAAWQLAQRGFRVRLSEMRGSGTMTAAHQTDGLAELVCSNSFRSDDDSKNAVGLMHHEMRRLDSLIMRAGEQARVPAGSAMAVDRDGRVIAALSDAHAPQSESRVLRVVVPVGQGLLPAAAAWHPRAGWACSAWLAIAAASAFVGSRFRREGSQRSRDDGGSGS